LCRSNDTSLVRLAKARREKMPDGLFAANHGHWRRANSRSLPVLISETEKTTAQKTTARSLSRHDADGRIGRSETRLAPDNSRVRCPFGTRPRRKHRGRNSLQTRRGFVP